MKHQRGNKSNQVVYYLMLKNDQEEQMSNVSIGGPKINISERLLSSVDC